MRDNDSADTLFPKGSLKEYPCEASEAAFLLGGIGTCAAVGGPQAN